MPSTNPYTSGDPALTLSGTCETGATVSLSGPDAPSSVTCSESAFSFSVPEASDGTYSYTVSQTDQAGNSASGAVTFVWNKQALTLSPSSGLVVAGGTQNFTAGGGSGSGYFFSISSNLSGGSIDSGTGVYTAGATAPVTDTISVTDSLGVVFQTATVMVRNSLNANISYTAGTDASYSFDASQIELVGGVCRLKNSGTSFFDQDDTGSGFGGAVSAVGVAWDAGSATVQFGNAGGCDSTSNNCSEMDSSWAPRWGNLAAYWKLNESVAGTVNAGSADFMDSSGNNHPGHANGSVTFGAAGKLKSAAQFDGSSAYVDLGTTVLNSLPTGSISMWVYPTANGAGAGSPFNNTTILANGAMYLGVLQSSSNNVLIYYYDGSYETIQSVAQLSLNSWHQIMYTWDAGTSALYIDGILDTTTALTWANVDAAQLNQVTTLGDANGAFNAQYFTGSIDEVAIWNTPLTLAEVQTIYSRQSANYAGTLTSRVIDAGSSSIWNFLSWVPNLPYFKELPSGGNSETTTGYASLANSSLMSGILGLWHLNETASGGALGGGDFYDASGLGNNGTAVGTFTFGVSGKLNKAALFDGSTAYIDVGSGMSPTASTFSAWINAANFSNHAYNVVVAKIEGSQNTIAITASGKIACYVAGVGGLVYYDGSGVNTLNLNQWYFVSMTYDSVTGLNCYVNGTLDGSAAANGQLAQSGTDIWIGANPSIGGRNFNGTIDEVAIWSRALSAQEEQQLYWRGADRIKYQVRSCSDSSCTTGSPPWLGPDGTNQTYFSELGSNSLPITGLGTVLSGPPNLSFATFPSLTVSDNQYFQYRAILESDDANSANGPRLASVSAGNGNYSNANPTIVYNTSIGFYSLSGLTEALGGKGCSGVPHYELSNDNTSWFYWNGGAWVQDNIGLYADANAVADINAHLSTFSGTPSSLYVKAFLHSSGATPCEIDTIGVTGFQ